jgi:hypothetical protein
LIYVHAGALSDCQYFKNCKQPNGGAMTARSLFSLVAMSMALLFSATTYAVKPDKPPKIYEPEVVEVDCDLAESVTPVQDVLATLKPVGDINVVQVTGTCDEILKIENFANLTIQSSSGATFGRVEVSDAGYITIWNVDLVGPYTNPVERSAIMFSSAGKLVVRDVDASCPVDDGNETGDCVDALALHGPGKVELQDFNLIGDWKVGIQTREKANVVLDGGSISAIEVHIGLRDESYIQISDTTFDPPQLSVHAFERSYIHSFVPIDTALVISSQVVGMKEDGSAYCIGAYPSAMVGSSLGDGPDLCE